MKVPAIEEKTGKIRRRRVLLEIETILASGGDMLRGIAKFVRETNRWDVHHDAGDWSLHGSGEGPSHVDSTPVERHIDGIITRVYDEASERAALEAIAIGIPVIGVLGERENCGVPLVHCDGAEIAKMALGHLRETSFTQFVQSSSAPATSRYADRPASQSQTGDTPASYRKRFTIA